MPRVSRGPRYFASKNGWFATLNGKPVRLTTGPKKLTQTEAWARYDTAKKKSEGLSTGDESLLSEVFRTWLTWLRTNDQIAPNTDELYTCYSDSFVGAYPDLLVKDLTPHHIEKWLSQPAWEQGTKIMALASLRAGLRWALEDGLITRDVFRMPGSKRLRLARPNYQGKRLAITDEEHGLLLEQALRRSSRGFAHALMFLYGTGARPAEMYLARANEWDETTKSFRIKAAPSERGRFKLARRGRDRRVYLPDYLVPLAKHLMARYPDGPLFRSEEGRPMNRNQLALRFERLGKTLAGKVRKGLTCYSYRHAFVTRWIEGKKDPFHLAELLGTSLTMIQKYYSHLFERHDALRGSLNDFV